MQAKMEERGLLDPKQGFPQTNALDLMAYREVFDLDYAMPIQREGGITLSLMTNGGEVEWLARDLLQVSTVEALKFLNDEYVEIMNRYPGEFVPTANAHALEEACRPVVEEMIRQGGAKAIAVASSYGDGADRVFLDSPKAEWLWEFAEANDIVVHIHPPMQSIGHESLMQYRLNEAVGRPFDSTVNGARMIASGVFDRHPKLQVLIVHMGGGLASIVGRLEFNWHLNYNGIKNPPAGKPYTNKRSPFDYFKTNILVDTMGFNAIGCAPRLRCAVWTEWCSAPISVRCHTGSKSMCRSSKTCFRVRLTANWCSGRQATEYSAWAYPIPISSRSLMITSCASRSKSGASDDVTRAGASVSAPGVSSGPSNLVGLEAVLHAP
jgi:predicted TIM-barrel fold metal-dependent hydrolase